MRHFKNILVGINLSEGDRIVWDELPAPSREAFERGLWLAKLNSSRLTLFNAVEVSAAAERLIAESAAEFTVIDRICEVLQALVDRAAAEGVEADLAVRFGRGWIEIIRKVLRDGHDLVVVGTRHHSAVRDLLLGTTGSKLFRKCPCPVWVTRPRTTEAARSVLVAHCLQPVGDKAMELGCSMAELEHSELHVLHALEHAELEQHVELAIDDRRLEELRAAARSHIDAQLANYKFVRPPKVEITTKAAPWALLSYIEQHGIDLLVMGTIARTGVAGLITGNTAERMLPRIPCSVIAVKPDGFVSPIEA